ncbi:MAG: nucleotidyl transferase AbiEii/AbiGii toxin family protein [Lentisphaerales bacterium]|nr:MAG: nucleotidyl transferase AbiEii/AbiGii toxin family protein [Lentisphaerales bacterium]
MNKVAQLDVDQRSELFRETAGRRNMKPAIAEKDFWVCWTLDKLFAHPEISKVILFKGGTTLSKVFGLIERFSEDIDLILDWRLLTNENPEAARSRTRQEKLNVEVNRSAQKYIAHTMLPMIDEMIRPVCSIEVNARDPNILNIAYPASFTDEYLLQYIQLEIGPLAAPLPHAEYLICPYAAEEFPSVFEEADCRVRAIKAERTFWEKATILHQEAHRPEDKPQPPKYSRHYYDLHMMAASPVKDSSLSDQKLLQDVVKFKRQVYPRSWARYDLAQKGTLKLMPPNHVLDAMKSDYNDMREMIFGAYPGFDEILSGLKSLEEEINQDI